MSEKAAKDIFWNAATKLVNDSIASGKYSNISEVNPNKVKEKKPKLKYYQVYIEYVETVNNVISAYSKKEAIDKVKYNNMCSGNIIEAIS